MKQTLSGALLNTGEAWECWRTVERLQAWLEADISAMKKEERAKRVNLINMGEYLKPGCKQNGTRLCPVVPSGRTKGNGHKETHGKCPLSIRKHFFIMRVAEHWVQLTQRDGCGVSILGDFQKLSGHVSGQTKCSCFSIRVEQVASRGPLQPQPFCHSVH